MMNTGRRQEITKLLETGREAEEGKIGGTLIAPRGPSQAPGGRRFGDLLVSDGLITQPQIDQALSEQKRTGEKLGEILVRLRLITEDRLGHFPSRHYGIPEVAVPEKIAPETIAVIPRRIARKYGVVPIGRALGSGTPPGRGPANPAAVHHVA